MSDHEKHEPPFKGATFFTLLSQCKTPNREHISINMYEHVWKHVKKKKTRTHTHKIKFFDT